VSNFEHLYTIYCALSEHDDLLFITLITWGFLGLNCLGELVQPDTQHLHSLCQSSLWYTVHWYSNTYSNDLPSYKADPF
jgi:hypothetical protein